MCLRKLKAAPALEYCEPRGLFGATTLPLSMQDTQDLEDVPPEEDHYASASTSSSSSKSAGDDARRMEAVNASAICYFSV
jgi:hypothetical protein